MKRTESVYSADAWWSVNKYQAKKIGIVPAILLSELIWSRKRFKSKEFFITAKELEDTLGIGEEARRNALKKLSDLGLITVTAKGVPKRYFYQINDSRLDEIMEDTSDEETPTLETMEPSHSEQGNPDTIIKKDIKNNINKEKEREEDTPAKFKEVIKAKDPLFPDCQMSDGEMVMTIIQEFLDEHWNRMAVDRHSLRDCQDIYDKLREDDKIAQLKRCLILHTYGTIDGQKKTFWSKTPPQPKFLKLNWNDIYSAKIPIWFERGFTSQAEYEADIIKTQPSSHSGMDDLKRQFFSGPMVSQERADQFMVELDELKEKINGKT